MLCLLFFQSAVVEIDKVPSNELVGVGGSKVPLRVVLSQPRLSNKHWSVFPLDGHLHVINRNLAESHFLPVRSGLRIGVVENDDVRFGLWRQRVTVEKPCVELGHWNDRSTRQHERCSYPISAFGNCPVS